MARPRASGDRFTLKAKTCPEERGSSTRYLFSYFVLRQERPEPGAANVVVRRPEE